MLGKNLPFKQGRFVACPKQCGWIESDLEGRCRWCGTKLVEVPYGKQTRQKRPNEQRLVP